MTRYFAEDRCKHGNLVCNWNVGTCGFGIGAECQDPSHLCPGGQRRELTGVMVADTRTTGDVTFQGLPPGRYVMVSLEEPE